MALKCCSTSQKADNFYFTDHPEKGRIKVYHSKCCKCGELMLDIGSGALATKLKDIYGKKAKKFFNQYPKPVRNAEPKTEEIIIPETKKTFDSASWGYGKSFEHINKDGTIVFKHRSYSYLTGRRLSGESKTQLQAV